MTRVVKAISTKDWNVKWMIVYRKLLKLMPITKIQGSGKFD